MAVIGDVGSRCSGENQSVHLQFSRKRRILQFFRFVAFLELWNGCDGGRWRHASRWQDLVESLLRNGRNGDSCGRVPLQIWKAIQSCNVSRPSVSTEWLCARVVWTLTLQGPISSLLSCVVWCDVFSAASFDIADPFTPFRPRCIRPYITQFNWHSFQE